MNNPSLIISASLFIIMMVIILILTKSRKNLLRTINESSIYKINLQYSQYENDMKLINAAIDRAIYITLSKYLNKTITFSNSSPTRTCVPGNYRLLIESLVHPAYTQTIPTDNGDEERRFFLIFVEQVYLAYVSSTSSGIKDLLYKWYSGYNLEDYQLSLVSKKVKPSSLPYITDYVSYWILNKYTEVKAAESELFENANNISDPNNTADAYSKLLEQYDRQSVSEIYLNIYHMYGVGTLDSSVAGKPTENKSNKDEKKEVKAK